MWTWFPDASLGVHHGSLSKEVRIQMEDDFKAGVLKGLICTSSLELGIDVGSADFVLQYNSPREVSRLVQRIGRSGHGVGEVSDGLVVATHEDDFAEAAVIARRALAEELEPVLVRQDNIAVLANQVVAMAATAAPALEANLKTLDRSVVQGRLAGSRNVGFRDQSSGQPGSFFLSLHLGVVSKVKQLFSECWVLQFCGSKPKCTGND